MAEQCCPHRLRRPQRDLLWVASQADSLAPGVAPEKAPDRSGPRAHSGERVVTTRSPGPTWQERR